MNKTAVKRDIMTENTTELLEGVPRDKWLVTRNDLPKKANRLIRVRAECRSLSMIEAVSNPIAYDQRDYWMP